MVPVDARALGLLEVLILAVIRVFGQHSDALWSDRRRFATPAGDAGVSYRASAAEWVVRLLALRRLSATMLAQCAALRREAGRCWTVLVTAHQAGRAQGCWLSVRALEQLGAAGGAGGAYALHSQTIQALAQKLDANLATGTALRKEKATQG